MESNLFISYSHKDEEHVKVFLKHIDVLKEKGLLSEWHDRKILAGDDFQSKINNNLEKADIICLFISVDFISSGACKDEKRKALELRKKTGTRVILIILSPCAWQDLPDIANLLALPTDAKPIASYTNYDKGWTCVYDGLKKVVENENKIKGLRMSGEFMQFLNDTDLLANAHSKKTTVVLDEVFVYPDLLKFNDDGEKRNTTIKAELLVDEFYDTQKIILAGENQSGKTALCKKLFVELRTRNFIPIYISDKLVKYTGSIFNRIEKSFNEQYSGVLYDEVPNERIVLILDDFHFASHKEKILKDIAKFNYQILIVDDIFSLSISDDTLTGKYTNYRIEECSPMLRDILIRKWVSLTDKQTLNRQNDNEFYRKLDTATELIEVILGKIMNSGIMPAYPFFILSILSTGEIFEKPLDQEITSQGYCYQALIYMCLRVLKTTR